MPSGQATGEIDLNAGAEIHFSLAPLIDRDGLEAAWLDLERRADASLFQSWGWIGTWLGVLPGDLDLRILTGHADGKLCALAIFAHAEQRRHGWLRSSGLFLSETGRPDYDALTVEYNGILADPAAGPDVFAQVVRFLAGETSGWDELYLSGIDPCLKDALPAAGLAPRLLALKPCDYVDLEMVRASGKGYLEGRSSNSRYQIRRALRRYEERDEIAAHRASSLEEAFEIFDELKQLHQAYWIRRGERGAFANPFFERFHRAFIERRFAAGEIELVRVTAGAMTVGCLYNFRYRDHVYAYQSGFAYEDDAALKPGMISHYLAIEQNLADGAGVYDFMAGYGQHKRSLGTGCRDMIWITGQRARLKYRLEDALRSAKNLLKNIKNSKEKTA